MRKSFLRLIGTLAVALALGGTSLLAQPDQPPVSSSDATSAPGQPWTPSYSGGAGSGAWQFCIAGHTNWPSGNDAGTELGNGTLVGAWTPPGEGSFTFWIRKKGDGAYNDTNPERSYTLTVAKSDQPSVGSDDVAIAPGQAWTPNYTGGAGGGAWQFCVANYTNWPAGDGTGTELPDGTLVGAWTPPGEGSYTFWIRKKGDVGYNDTTPERAYTLTVALHDQPGVSSADASIHPGENWTPTFDGGAGTGAWQFCVANYTNWPTGSSAGTALPDGTVVSAWTPTSEGSYIFWIRKKGDGNYNDTTPERFYTLTVSLDDQPSVGSADATIAPGQSWAPTFGGGAGTGSWQFCIAGKTNWPTDGQPGTALPDGTRVTTWTANAEETLQFWIRKKGDGTYRDTTPERSYTLTIASLSQPPVTSADATIGTYQAWTPIYSGGAGNGSWQFCVAGYTNWPTGNQAGTALANGTLVPAWAPPGVGNYTFWIRKKGDGSYGDTTPERSYTLTVIDGPTENDITVTTSFSPGQVATVSAFNSISTSGTVIVPATANITFNSGRTIALRHGFSAQAGSKFHGLIGGVGSSYTLRVVGGSGSASGLAAGAVVPIAATQPGEIFITWSLVSGSGAFGNAGSASTTFTLGNSDATIRAIYGTDSITGTVGSIFSYKFGTPNTTYSATGLPPGLQLNGQTGEIYGTPTQDGSFSVSITASNGAMFTITIVIVPGPSTLVGTLAGAVSVDNKGAANYAIELPLPPGRAGLQPSLALSYNSDGGNGPLGIGFDLSTGYPHSITRGRSILARDGIVRGVNFDPNDKFYLDGKRLLCVSGNYGEAGSTYRTEVDSFVTITAFGAGTHIDGFRLEGKDGLMLCFGKNVKDSAGTTVYVDADGFQQAGDETTGQALAWALKWVEDRAGNYIEYRYDEPNSPPTLGAGEHVLTSIHYTGNRARSLDPEFTVSLRHNASNNPSGLASDYQRPDGGVTYLYGRKKVINARLDRIEIFAKGDSFTATPARSFGLKYDAPSNHGFLRLTQITREDRAPNGVTTMPIASTTFHWGADPAPLGSFSTYEGWDMPVTQWQKWQNGDFNANGRADILVRKDNEWQIVSGSGQGVSAVLTATPAGDASGYEARTSQYRLRKTGDFNGDGRTDLLLSVAGEGSTGGGWYIALAKNEGGFEAPIRIIANNDWGSGLQIDKVGNAASVVVADLDGDGLDEVLYQDWYPTVSIPSGAWYGTGFNFEAFGEEIDAGFSISEGADWAVAKSTVPYTILNPKYVNGELKFTPTTRSFWTPPAGDAAYDPVEIEAVDLNGDSLPDFLVTSVHMDTHDRPSSVHIDRTGSVLINKGDGTFSSDGFALPVLTNSHTAGSSDGTSSGTSHRLTGDVNGDGLLDLVTLNLDYMDTNPAHPVGSWTVALSKGNGSYDTTTYSGIPVQVAVNGATVNTFLQRSGLVTNQLQGVQGDEAQEWKLSEITGLDITGVALFDYNGDGRKDFIWYVKDTGWQCILAGRDGFDSAHPISIGGSGSLNYWVQGVQLDNDAHVFGSDFQFDVVPSDVDGDGREDLLLATHRERNGTGTIACAFAPVADTYRLLGVTNGFGATTSVAYKPITDPAIYTSGATVSYPIRELITPLRVVSDVWHDGGADNAVAHFSYQYSGRRLDLSGRGDLGFHSFVTLDQQTQVFKYQFLAQSFPMTGLTAREQTYRYWTSDGSAKFRLISSHDNTVVFDEVVKSAADSTPWGTVYPFMSKAVESRWEDAATEHFTAELGGASSKSELLFPKTLPANPHITISAKSWFDEQSRESDPPSAAPGSYFASDTNSDPDGNAATTDRANVVLGTPNYNTFHGLSFDHKITYGNLRKLETDFGGGFKETVTNTYKPASGALTGLLDTVATTVTSPNYGTQSAPTKSYTYWETTPLVATEQLDAAGDKLDLTTTYTRDTLGRVTATSITGYNNPGDPQHIGTYTISSATAFDARFDLPTTTKNAAPYEHATTVAYHPIFGSPTSVTDVNNATVTTSYDALGRPVAVTDALKGLVNRSEYRWTSASAQDWTRTQTVFPPAGHTGVASGAPITGVSGVPLASTFVVKSTETRASSVVPFKPTVWSYHDRLGRVIRTIKESFAGKTIVDTAYNSLGQVIAVSEPYPETSTTIYWTKTAYDALGRVSTITAPNGTVTTTTYQGRATLVSVDAPNLGGVDPVAQVNATLVDAKGRTMKVWNPDPASGAGPAFSDNVGTTSTTPSITFDLDGFGRMRTTTLKDQTAVITATYDELGRQTSLNDPDKGSWSYLNNALGQIVSQTDARQNVTSSIFDRLGRPLSRVTSEAGNGPVETTAWHYYDAAANTDLHLVEKGTQGWIGAPQRQETSTAGAPGYAGTNSVAATVHYFDALGRPSIDLTTVDGNWFNTNFTYDDYSRVRELRYYWRRAGLESAPQSPQDWEDFGITYTYDAKGYLLSIADTTATPRTWWQADADAGYDHLDRAVLVRKGSGHWTQRTYRPEDGALTAIKTGPTAGASAIQDLGFTFDGLGNLTERSGAGGVETLGYDPLNRLTSSSTQGAVSYFDNGNIKSKTGVAGETTAIYTYDSSHPHAVATAFGYSMGYDASGNLSSRTQGSDSWRFKYAGFDKPRWMTKTASGGTAGSEFLYDANRSRTVQLEYDQVDGSGAPVHYVRKRVYGLGPTLEVNYDNTAASGSPTWAMKKVRIYVPGPDGTVGAREFDPAKPSGQQETALVYHYDHLGSIDAITPFGSTATTFAATDAGKPGQYSEDAWGQRRNPLSWTGAPSTTDTGGAASLTPRGFTGHEMLDDLGLVHMNGRIYDPLLGRMLSADIIVQAPSSLQSYNRYSYVANNPLSFTDKSGFSINDPNDNELLRKSRANTEAGKGWTAMGYGLAAVPQLMFDSTIHIFRNALPQGIASAKQDLAAKNASGKLSGYETAIGRLALASMEAGTGVPSLVANADRIPKIVSGLPGKIVGDVKAVVKDPTVSTVANVAEDAAMVYGGVKLTQGLAGAIKNTLAASTETAVATDAVAAPKWPPNRGFEKTPDPAVLQPGSTVDRYGSPDGTFVAPEGTPFGARSLPADFANKPLNAYEVVKPIDVNAGVSAPWFGQPGKGIQFELPKTVQELLDSGHLIEKK
jgi:RHS repeat-associated protein